jgi:hypothetical protein
MLHFEHVPVCDLAGGTFKGGRAGWLAGWQVYTSNMCDLSEHMFTHAPKKKSITQCMHIPWCTLAGGILCVWKKKAGIVNTIHMQHWIVCTLFECVRHLCSGKYENVHT